MFVFFKFRWLCSPPVFSGVRVTRSLVLYVCFVDVCPFVHFLLAIVLSILLRCTNSDYPFGIFKLLFQPRSGQTKDYKIAPFICCFSLRYWDCAIYRHSIYFRDVAYTICIAAQSNVNKSWLTKHSPILNSLINHYFVMFSLIL